MMIEQIITSSVLIIVILIATVVLEKKIHPCIKYSLWLLVAVKLLVPMPNFQTDVSIMNLANKIDPSTIQFIFMDNELNYDGDSTELKQDSSVVFDEQAKASVNESKHINIFCLIWIVGIVVCAMAFVYCNIRFYKNMRRNRKLLEKRYNKLDVYKANGIESPCLFGIYRPSIYLSEDYDLSKEQVEYILTHEYTHYKHKDNIWGIVRCLCVTIYWFNPLVWIAAICSIKDSELACDAGTLKKIGSYKRTEYCKTLIHLAKGFKSPVIKYNVLECSTNVSRGSKDMKKRIRLIVEQPKTKTVTLMALILVCISIVGCTYGNAFGTAEEQNTNQEKDTLINVDDSKIEEIGNAIEQSSEESIDSEKINPENTLYNQVVLSNEIGTDQVGILVEPSVRREYVSYYYIPQGDDQQWLLQRVKELNFEGTTDSLQWAGMRNTGWQIVYNDIFFHVFEGGYLYYSYSEGDDLKECFIEDPLLCDYIQNMLQEKLNYYQYDIKNISNIVSAKLDVCSIFTEYKAYSQTITDEDILKQLENWFCNAEYISGGGGCGNEAACLELRLESGEIVNLSIATDSCTNYGINGVYYDYGSDSNRDSVNFYRLFDEIPWTLN